MKSSNKSGVVKALENSRSHCLTSSMSAFGWASSKPRRSSKSFGRCFFTLAHAFFLCVDRARLAGNVIFRDNLLNVLLEREQTWEKQSPAVPANSAG